MTDDVLDKYVKGRNAKEQSPADEDDTIDVPGFGWLRGIRDTAIMLEIRCSPHAGIQSTCSMASSAPLRKPA